MSQPKVYIQKKGIVHRKENDGFSILFNPEKGNTAILDSNACFIWDQCARNVTVAEVMKIITESFDSVNVKDLESKVQVVLDDLLIRGFLYCEGNSIG